MPLLPSIPTHTHGRPSQLAPRAISLFPASAAPQPHLICRHCYAPLVGHSRTGNFYLLLSPLLILRKASSPLLSCPLYGDNNPLFHVTAQLVVRQQLPPHPIPDFPAPAWGPLPTAVTGAACRSSPTHPLYLPVMLCRFPALGQAAVHHRCVRSCLGAHVRVCVCTCHTATTRVWHAAYMLPKSARACITFMAEEYACAPLDIGRGARRGDGITHRPHARSRGTAPAFPTCTASAWAGRSARQGRRSGSPRN